MTRAELATEMMQWGKTHLNQDDFARLIQIMGYYTRAHDMVMEISAKPAEHSVSLEGKWSPQMHELFEEMMRA